MSWREVGNEGRTVSGNRLHSAFVLAVLCFATGVPSVGPSFHRHAQATPGGFVPMDDDETREAVVLDEETAEDTERAGEPE